jgi:tetratricopeptide (TPR) repeat protein
MDKQLRFHLEQCRHFGEGLRCRLLMVVIAIICGSSFRLSSCTMFTATQKGVTLAAFNNDWWDPNPRVFFMPGTNGLYGRICIGFDFPLGGMNEKGLVWDWLTCSKVTCTNSAGKEIPRGKWVFDDILARCATVEEGVALLKKYDLSQFNHSHFLLVDKSGKSAVVEGDGVIFGQKQYQVLTNFRLGDGNDQTPPCERYAMTEKALRNSLVTVPAFCKMLASAHMENGASPTQYSYVADLTHGRLYLYQFHDYANEVALDLAADLGKPYRIVELARLFPPLFAKDEYKNHGSNGLRPKHLAELFEESLPLNDFPTILRNLLRQQREFADEMVFEPAELSDRGYYYYCEKKYDLALNTLLINAELFPKFADTFLHLGCLYEETGDFPQAKKNYEIAFALNPDLTIARKKAKQVETRLQETQTYQTAIGLKVALDEPVHERPARLASYTGEYELARNRFFRAGNLRVTIGPEHTLLLWYPKLPVYKYRATLHEGVFIQENDPQFSISFMKDARGNVENIACTYPGGAVFQRRKIQ